MEKAFHGIDTARMGAAASIPFQDAAEQDAANFPCELCGHPSERKRRRDRSWYYYSRCRRCRRENLGRKPDPARIGEGRLLYLLELLHVHLLKLKDANWKYAPKRVVVQRLRDLIAVVKQ